MLGQKPPPAKCTKADHLEEGGKGYGKKPYITKEMWAERGLPNPQTKKGEYLGKKGKEKSRPRKKRQGPAFLLVRPRNKEKKMIRKKGSAIQGGDGRSPEATRTGGGVSAASKSKLAGGGEGQVQHQKIAEP